MRAVAVLILVASALGGEPPALDAAAPTPVAAECIRDGVALQHTPAVAFGRKAYLVAWSDGSRMLGKETADIYCARIEPRTGKALDPQGIAVCRAEGLQERPAVAFDGANFLIVWQDLRNGADYDLYAARVSEEGKVLDPDGFPVSKRASNQAWPAVAFAAGQYVVAWMDARQYPVYGIYFARLSPEGKVLDPDGLPLDAEDPAKIAKLKPPGETWMGDRDYWWHNLASRTVPSIASNGRVCLVAYEREYPFAGSGRPAVTVAVVNPSDGSVTKPAKAAGGLSPVWTGKSWALGGPAWKSGWTPEPLLGACALPETPVEVKEPGATVDVVKAFGGGYNVGKGSTASFPSSAAFNGHNALVVMQYAWRKKGQDKSPAFALLAVRVAVEGGFAVLDPKPVVLASADAPGFVSHPALAAGPDGECLLVYEADSDVKRCILEARVVRP